MNGSEVVCPAHRGKFDVRTGTPGCFPVSEQLQVYRVLHSGS